MDRSWKKLFEQKIRSRGKEYSYFNVSDFVCDDNDYQATVRGSEDYKVSISSDYQKMSCTCPYANDGRHCKHMAAVLYYAELLEKQEKESERKTLEKAERQTHRNQIIELQKLYGKQLHTSIVKDLFSVLEWKKGINDLIKTYKNKDNYIGYWEADDFIFNLLKRLEFLYSLISFCEDKKAIDASIWLCTKIHSVDVDDSSTGCMTAFENEMLSLWEEIVEYSDKNKQLLKTALTAYGNNYPAKEKMLKILIEE